MLIEYPKDSRQCWSPAVILHSSERKSQVHVRFYDCIDKNLSPNEHAISISEAKFQEYAARRIQLETSLCGQVIVGLNGDDKTYLLGTILQRTESGHKYTIRWCNDKETDQAEQHLFGAFTRRNQHRVGDRVLALNKEQYVYKPARVIALVKDGKELIIRFTDPEENDRYISFLVNQI